MTKIDPYNYNDGVEYFEYGCNSQGKNCHGCRDNIGDAIECPSN